MSDTANLRQVNVKQSVSVTSTAAASYSEISLAIMNWWSQV